MKIVMRQEKGYFVVNTKWTDEEQGQMNRLFHLGLDYIEGLLQNQVDSMKEWQEDERNRKAGKPSDERGDVFQT